MSTLKQISQLAPIFSFITIIIALVFGIIQFKQFKQQRKDLAAVEVMRTMQDSDFNESITIINNLKDGITLKELNQNELNAILALSTKFETLEYLVYKKIIPIEFVEQLVGGECIRIWNKLYVSILEFRKTENKIFLEWFEWLAYQFKKRNRHQSKSALDQFKNWNP